MANSGSNDGDRQGRRPGIGLFIVVSVVVFAVWGGWGLVTFYLGSADMATRGQFGDLFGGVNALFTGFAFAGLIYTIVLQRNELEMQRKELALSRNAQQGSQEALSKQVEQTERSSRLSAISTLTTSYGRLIDNLAEEEQRLNRELEHEQDTLRSRQDGLQHKKTDLYGLQSELDKIQAHLDNPQITDPDNRARLKTDKQNMQSEFQKQQQEVKERELAVRLLSSHIQDLEARISDTKNKRDKVHRNHDALIFHLEQQVEQSLGQTISEAGNIPSEEAVGEER